MSSPLYDEFGMSPGMKGFADSLAKLMKDPVGFLAQQGLNISPNIAKDPYAIVQSMLSSGRVTQAQVNDAMNRMQTLKQFLR